AEAGQGEEDLRVGIAPLRKRPLTTTRDNVMFGHVFADRLVELVLDYHAGPRAMTAGEVEHRHAQDQDAEADAGENRSVVVRGVNHVRAAQTEENRHHRIAGDAEVAGKIAIAMAQNEQGSPCEKERQPEDRGRDGDESLERIADLAAPA